MSKRFLFLLLASVALPGPCREPKVRVKVGSRLKNIVLSGLDLNRKLLFDRKSRQYDGLKSIAFDCSGIARKVLRKKKSIALASLSSRTGLVSWKNNRYRGQMVVVTTPKRKSCDLINELGLENYLSSLLAKEMNSTWPLEVLKAQAIAARTYAYEKMLGRKVDSTYDLINSEKHQVNGTFFDETISTFKAAQNTRGLILKTHKGQITPTFFHSKCGGKTWRPKQVWGNRVEGYTSVNCPYCEGHGVKAWNFKMSIGKFLKTVPKLYARSTQKYPGLRKRSGKRFRMVGDRWENGQIRFYYGDTHYRLEKSSFRRLFGRKKFPSNHFKIKLKHGNLVFYGKGNGHGVGMCQYGALELADRGWSYKQILKHYFPNHELTKIY